jgi:hypothetical protein
MLLDEDGMDGSSDEANGVDRACDALFASIGEGGFRNAILTRQTVHLPGIVRGLEGSFTGVPDIEEALVRQAFLPDDLRIYQGRDEVDLVKCRYVNRGKVEPQMLANGALMGLTMVFNSLECRMPKAHQLAARVEEWAGDAVEMVLIAGFGRESGLPLHHDKLPALIIQLEGEKSWTLHGDPVAPGETNKLRDDPGPTRQLTMNPGDVLLLHPGQRHFCSTEGHSVHLAFLVHSTTGKVVRRRLEKALGESILLKEPVPAILGAENDARVAAEFRSHLHKLVDELDIKKILEQERRHRRIRPRVKLQPRRR